MPRRGLMAVVVALVVGAGCSSTNHDKSLSETEEHLYTIGKAYIQASSMLDRGPKNFDEIKSFLPANASSDLFVSPDDGQDFVILWGVDFNKLPPTGRNVYYVGAYEKTGKGGRRVRPPFPHRRGLHDRCGTEGRPVSYRIQATVLISFFFLSRKVAPCIVHSPFAEPSLSSNCWS